MTVSLVQSKTATISSGSLTFDSAPTAGHLLVARLSNRDTPDDGVITGWTQVGGMSAGAAGHWCGLWYTTAPGGSVSVPVFGSINGRLTIMEFDCTGATLGDSAIDGGTWPGPGGAGVGVFLAGDVTLTEGLLVGAAATGDPGGGGHTDYTEDSSYTNVDEGSVIAGATPESIVGYRSVDTAGTYDYAPTGVTTAGGHPSYGAIVAAFEVTPAFTADFAGTPRTGAASLTVAFTDESFGGTGTPDTWLWDFGDGSTSTSQNPTNIYDAPGSYTVSLTVTTDDDETDDITRVAYIVVTGDYVAPDPGGAILEIYVGLPGSPRWGSARWGQDPWNSSGWVDVTPQGITVQIRWGSHQPERGILLDTEAATWLVTTYDPERLLDPGNEDSPYHTDLVAGLPIRLRHRGTVIRQGIAERIAYFHADSQGAIRATDNVSLMARTPVPSDSVVADTLYERARDVIAAAGLRITVAPDPPSGDPALAPRLEGDRSVWRHVADAAEQVLHIPYVDRIGTLHFRPWASPYDRGRSVDETNLVDLGTQVDAAGLYSVVQATDEVSELVVERRLTPVPRYGRVTYTRSELTPDADGWTAAVLADRSLQTVQWVPGMIWPLTADDVEYFATLEAMERLDIRHFHTEPVVDITGVIVGGEINVKGKKDSAALWSFELELSQTASQPLIDDIVDGGEYLLHEAGDAYLYAG